MAELAGFVRLLKRLVRLPARSLRLLALYARMDVLWILRAKSSAATFYLSEWLRGIGVVVATGLIAARFDGIGPWSRSEVAFLLGYSLLVRGTVDVVFGWNLAHVSRRIGRGQLDHMLLQPVPLPVLVLVEGFSPLTGSGLFVSGVALLAFAGHGLGALGPAAFALHWAASVAVVIAFSYAWGSVAFWAPRAAEEINSSTMELVDQLRAFPLDGLAPGLLALLVSAVPVGLVAWWPARVLLQVGEPSGSALFASPNAPFLAPALAPFLAPLAALVLAAVAAAIFARGLGHYRATGSIRYLSLGHRR